jgi:5-methylcytosine-specific restriction protein A
LSVTRVWRDQALIEVLEQEVILLLGEVETVCSVLRAASFVVQEAEVTRTEFPISVRRQAIERSGHFCEAIGGVYGLEPGVRCNIPLTKGVEFDHYPIRAADGGAGTLENCLAVCRVCHRHKTRTFDLPMIAKRKRIIEKTTGVRKAGTAFSTNRLGPLKRRMNGETVPR